MKQVWPILVFGIYFNHEFPSFISKLNLDEFVQSQTAQIAVSPIVQLPTAQLPTSQVPPLLCLTTFTNRVGIVK